MGRTFKDSGGKGGYNRSCKWSKGDNNQKRKPKKNSGGGSRNNNQKRFSDQSYDDIIREEYGDV